MDSFRQAAGLRLSLSVQPSLSFVHLPPSLPPPTHSHKLKLPDRKYRLGSQRGFLIQTSPVEQPEVAAPTPLSLVPYFILAPLTLSFWLCGFQPAAPACPCNTCTHKDPHILMIAHKCTPTTLLSSLEEPKAIGQLTKALCGVTYSWKYGEFERRGLMILANL